MFAVCLAGHARKTNQRQGEGILSPEYEDYLDNKTAIADEADRAQSSSVTLEEFSDAEANVQDASRANISVDILDSCLTSPRSCYVPFTPSAPPKTEDEALQIIQQAVDNAQMPTNLDFIELSLNDFAIYYDAPEYPCEMRCLNHLDTKTRHSGYFFDGILSIADTRLFVTRVPISAVPIGNYGCLNSHSVQSQIWIKSELCRGSDVFYKLETPAEEYKRFFEPFTWVADLAKHVIDFMLFMAEKDIKVSIHHFRTEFRAWLPTLHGSSVEFANWLAKHPSGDFRTSVVANIAFIYKEAFSVLGQEEAYFHAIWDEVLDFARYPKQPLIKNACSALTRNKTIVTDYIHQLFSHLSFGDQLQASTISAKSQTLRDRIILDSHLERAPCSTTSATIRPILNTSALRSIKPGATISTRRDSENSGSMWKREVSNGFTDVDRWFGLVQKVQVKDQHTELEVLWYYRPVDTSCGVMKYPWANEIFLSDHCSCLEKHKIYTHEVLDVHEVEFGGNSTTASEFFCRQLYISQERQWLALKEHDLHCPHTSTKEEKDDVHKLGETYLVHIGGARSEPCELVGVLDGRPAAYRFRKLLRRREVDPAAPTARPNELVYSGRFVACSSRRILGKCHVRVFKPNATIPAPYDRDGVGSFFYMSHEQVVGRDNTLSYRAIRALPSTFQQGFDPAVSIPQLRGLDLFCGGGNFGRGLEEGGAIQMSWANDIDTKAIHTYMANSNHPELISPFLGSIDDLLQQAIDGRFSKSVPPIGMVDFVSGGSPCPGFSVLTNDKTTNKQRKNQSLIAAFASFIDLYRPKFGVLENVPGIMRTKTNRDQDVFSQLLCAVVGMGYQAQMILLDASSCGATQRRTRVFLVIAAPGCKLPRRPQQTHSDPPNTRTQKLGQLSTGEAFVERNPPAATPFPFVSALQATRDLPKIHDGQTDTCIEFPDHRLAFGLTRLNRSRISLIPKQPWGMNFLKASLTVLTPSQLLCFKRKRQDATANLSSTMRKKWSSYGRMFPHRLMETIVTRSNPADRKNGRQLHWSEDRTISVMEARRAQGFPDEEVLLGNPSNQYRIVGNSVARQVALALGVAVREAWVDSHWGTETHVMKRLVQEKHADIVNSSTHSEPPIVPSKMSTSSSSDARTRASCSDGGPEPSPSPSPRAIPLRKRRSTHSRLGAVTDESRKRSRL